MMMIWIESEVLKNEPDAPLRILESRRMLPRIDASAEERCRYRQPSSICLGRAINTMTSPRGLVIEER